MKIYYLLFAIGFAVFNTNLLFGQDYAKLESIQLNDKEDYVKHEDLVKECANYLLNSPVNILKKDLNRVRALQFMMRWMSGTPDHMFHLDEPVASATRSNTFLLGIYMASMTKFVLEDRDRSGDQDEIKYNSFLTFIQYCEDPENKVKQNKTIKELIRARNDNTLKEYLRINPAIRGVMQ